MKSFFVLKRANKQRVPLEMFYHLSNVLFFIPLKFGGPQPISVAPKIYRFLKNSLIGGWLK